MEAPARELQSSVNSAHLYIFRRMRWQEKLQDGGQKGLGQL